MAANFGYSLFCLVAVAWPLCSGIPSQANNQLDNTNKKPFPVSLPPRIDMPIEYGTLIAHRHARPALASSRLPQALLPSAHIEHLCLNAHGEGPHELLGFRGSARFVLEIPSARSACAGEGKCAPGRKSGR